MENLHLYDSTICRLCAADNGNELLFVCETGEANLSSLVNQYLPLKVSAARSKCRPNRAQLDFLLSLIIFIVRATTALIKCSSLLTPHAYTSVSFRPSFSLNLFLSSFFTGSNTYLLKYMFYPAFSYFPILQNATKLCI